MARSDTLPHILLIGGDGNLSGVPRHLEHICRALAGAASVTIVSDMDKGGYKFAHPRTTIRGLGARRDPVRMIGAARALLTCLRASNADLIWFHARLPVVIGRVALLLRLWRPAAAVAFTAHGLPYGKGHVRLLAGLSLTLDRLFARYGPPVHEIVLSNEMAARRRGYLAAWERAGENPIVLPNCSRLGKSARKEPGNHRLIMTSRAARQKDHAAALRIFAELPPQFTLKICGPGTQDRAFCRLLETILPAGTRERVFCAGPVNDISAALNSADAYLLTSRYEGVPIGALEAAEVGLPLILSDFDGASTLTSLHPTTLTIPLKDARADADAIAAFLPSAVSSSAEIRAVWRRNWSEQAFAKNLMRLLPKLLRPASINARQTGCLHETKAPDRRRQKDISSRLPTQQQ